MPILRIAPGRNLEAFPGLSVIDDQTSPKTHLAWIRSIEAGLKNWEERVKQSRSPVTSLPKIIFIATEKISKLSIEPLEETYDQSQVDSQYPAHYRIPPTTLSDKLSSTDRVTRAVRFALASLLFTMTIRTPPFEDLSDEAVQEEYEQGRYPEVVTALSDPVLVRLLRYWSWEFEEAWVPTIPPETTSSTIAKGIGIASDVVCDSALLVADAIEFSAVGPVAVSIAGGVQSAIAIGSVAGSSLFSWSWGKTKGVSTTASTDAAVVVSPGAVVAGVEPRKSPWELFKDVVKRDGPQIECKEVVDQPNEKVLSVENKDEKKQEKSPEEKGLKDNRGSDGSK